jgi:transcription elongation factor Elf1
MQEKEETGWVSALIKCDLCGHESLSVHKYSCNTLECANCGHMSHYEILKNYTDESEQI